VLADHGPSVSVALHLVDLDAAGISVGEALNWLTPTERKRYQNQLDAAARTRFAIGRASLRKLIDAPAGSSDFSLGPHGKPHLPDGPHFSFAASGDRALIAVSADGPIGVDIETVRDVVVPADWREVHPALGALDRGIEGSGTPPALRFLRAWTRLEAIVKRDGGRLSQALYPDQDRSGPAPDPSQVVDVELGETLVGALAFHGSANVDFHGVDLAVLFAKM